MADEFFHVIEDGPWVNPLDRKLTPEQEASLAPLKRDYERTLAVLRTAQDEYMEAYGQYVVATRRILGEIP